MTSNDSILSIVEPLSFHSVHGEQIRLSEGNTRATRDRLNHTLVFTNRPVLANEIVQVQIEQVATEFYGLMRFGFTTVDPNSLIQDQLPKAMPPNDNQRWFIPTPRNQPNIQKNSVISLKYTAEGEIFVDFDGSGFVRELRVGPIAVDSWSVFDLNGVVSQIRIVQNRSRVETNPVTRARQRYLHYTNNRRNENSSTYYSDKLSPGLVTINQCDENCMLTDNIAARTCLFSSVTVDENLKRCMCVVMQILDMDHTYPTYLTIRCLIDRRASNEYSKQIDATHGHLTLGDEIGLRVLSDGSITFSCNNRHVKPLFNIDLTVNDNPAVEPTSYRLEFVMNGRVTGLRLIGIYHPTDEEAKPPPATVGGGCQANIRYRVCPNGLSGLLLPCRHLCVCHECGQALVGKFNCPKCRKQVQGCIKVFKD